MGRMHFGDCKLSPHCVHIFNKNKWNIKLCRNCVKNCKDRLLDVSSELL